MIKSWPVSWNIDVNILILKYIDILTIFWHGVLMKDIHEKKTFDHD